MAAEAGGLDLVRAVTLLGAAVVAVPLFKRLGLGSVLGYLAGGLAIGPFGLKLVDDPLTILHMAELGVVMFLFVVGLEMQPSHLWSLRRQIFGLGSMQCLVAGMLLTGVGMAFGFSWQVSFVSAMGFVLTSTAIVMQLLAERGDIAAPRGQRMVSILLFEDLLIVPLLAIVAFLAPASGAVDNAGASGWVEGLMALGSLAALIGAGLWLLNPLFRILANAGAREVMTAAALLVVLGSALLMQMGGMTMAMGAFIAGVLLSQSAFRHQLEADIEPFRGLLLGLFFLSVGMSLDLSTVARNWPLIVAGVLSMMVVKALCIYGVARLLKTPHDDAMDRAVVMAQGGEFAFVLFSAALSQGVIPAEVNANMTAIVVLSMALTPLVVIAYKRLKPVAAESLEGIDEPEHESSNVLVIGFGRVGQIVTHCLLARGETVTIIDTDTEGIRTASEFGFKVFYGDGTRLDVLHAAGAATAQAIVVCVDKPAVANTIAEYIAESFPQARLLVRAFDRRHLLALMRMPKVDGAVREAFDGSLALGRAAVMALGATAEEADAAVTEVRRRDEERLQKELAGDQFAGRSLMFSNIPQHDEGQR